MRRLPVVAGLVLCAAAVPAHADTIYGFNDGLTGAVVVDATGGDRPLLTTCAFREESLVAGVAVTLTGSTVAGIGSGGERAVSARVRCELHDENGTVVASLVAAQEGTVATVADVLVRPAALYTVCAQGLGHWSDNTIHQTVLACRAP
jgi:hypothetical protein